MIGSRRIRLSFATTLACLAAATPAIAQEDGVFIDPQSPSAKEYALPIESARRLADPSTTASGRVERGAAPAPLFGEGIGGSGGSQDQTDAAAAAAAAAGSGSGGGAGSGSGSGGATGSGPSGIGPGTAAASIPGTPEGGLSLLFIGAALLVLIAGAVVGLLLRRRHDA